MIIDFFSSPIFVIIGGFSTILVVLNFFYIIFLVFKGILPVWYRLGIGLSKREIAIFAHGDDYASLSNLINDSSIFSKTTQVTSEEIKRAEKITVYLLHWDSFKGKIDDVLEMKKDTVPLVVYAPQSEGRIDDDSIEKISKARNTIVVNFKGRLLNDILISLITTSYDK